MKPAVIKIKIGVSLLIFLLFLTGRLVNLYLISKRTLFFEFIKSIQNNQLSQHILLTYHEFLLPLIFFVTYSLTITLLAWLITDLILARANILNKIRLISFNLFFIIITITVQLTLVEWCPSTLHIRIAFSLMALSLIMVIITLILDWIGDSKQTGIQESERSVVNLLRINPLILFLETIFRLMPAPRKPGLYRIGTPDKDSPVIITGNFDLTIRRVCQALHKSGDNCWLLSCNSHGINIWCSSLAGHFPTQSIIKAITTVKLHQLVSHRNLVLPQLAAASIDRSIIRELTGFSSQFGPIDIKDLQQWRTNPKNLSIRQVDFPLKKRLEMAAGTLLIPLTLLFFVFNYIGLHHLLLLVPILYLVSFCTAALFPIRPIKNIYIWSLMCGLIAGGTTLLLSLLTTALHPIIYPVTIGVTTLYFINEFEGWSPLVKFSMNSAYKNAKIKIDKKSCSGCGMCVTVCPKGVYSIVRKKSIVSNMSACISCKSCIMQCPVSAIIHSCNSLDETLPASLKQ